MHYVDDREQLRHVRRPLNLQAVEREAALLIGSFALTVIGFVVGFLIGYEG